MRNIPDLRTGAFPQFLQVRAIDLDPDIIIRPDSPVQNRHIDPMPRRQGVGMGVETLEGFQETGPVGFQSLKHHFDPGIHLLVHRKQNSFEGLGGEDLGHGRVPAENICFLDNLFFRLLEGLPSWSLPMTKTLRSLAHETLIESLVAARKSSGLSQTELATRLRCHQSFIARIETGQRRIDVVEFLIIAAATGADAQAILASVAGRIPEQAGL